MILVNHYSIWPPIPKTIFIKHCRVEIIAFPFVLFHSNRFFNVCCLFRQQFSAAYLLKLFLLLQHAHTTLVMRCDKPELTCWCLCSLHTGMQMSSNEMVGSRDGCRHFIAESTVDAPIRLFWQIFSARTASFSCPLAWSTAYIWSLFDFCKPFTGMIPAIASISRLLCLQGTHGSFKYFPKNALLSFCRNMKSAVHVPYAGWLILSCSALARTHNFKNFLSSIQMFCCEPFTMLWYDYSDRCLCVQSSMSSPLHHFSYRRLSVLICFWAPVSFSSCFCTSFFAAPLRISLELQIYTWIYIYIYTCIYSCICVYIYSYIYVCIYILKYVPMHIHVYVYIFICIYIHICVHVYKHVCIHIYIHICIYIYKYI